MRAIGSDEAASRGYGAHSHRRWCPAEAGTTLLEVLVVAAILLVGILTVIRVFPVGFDVVERGAYTTIASRYAQTLLDDLRSRPRALPDGIVPAVYLSSEDPVLNTRWLVNSNALRPVDIEPRAPQAGDNGLRQWANSLVQCRRVYGETTRVPRAVAVSGVGNVSRYVLQFAPIEYYQDHANRAAYYDLMTVYSLAPYIKVDRDQLGRYANRDGYYAIDPDDEDAAADQPRRIYFSKVGYKRTFKLDYAWRPVSGSNPNDYDQADVQYVTDKIMWVDADADPANDASAAYGSGGAPVTLGGSGTAFVWNSEVVRRRLVDRAAETPGAGDIYNYSLVNPTVGVLEFDPRAAGMPVGITYSVMDWGILHDDVDVPMAADPSMASLPAEDQLAWVKLSFPFIDRSSIGAPQETDGSGNVTIQGDVRPGMQQPIIIQDIDPNSQTYGSLIDPNNNNDGAADAKETWTFDDPIRNTDGSLGGRLALRVAKFQSLNSGQGVRRVRIFYRSTDGFSAQVVKPYASYLPVLSGALEPSYNRYCYLSPGTTLYFALSDVGKSVSVDYTYQDATDGSLRRVAGEMHTIGTVRRTLDSSVGPRDYGAIVLNVPGGAGALRSVDAVRGMSLEVRVLWPKRGVPCRMYKILQTAWAGESPASFWEDLQEGHMLAQGVSAAVAKPQDL